MYEPLGLLYKTHVQLYDTQGLLILPPGAISEPTGPLCLLPELKNELPELPYEAAGQL